MGNLPQRGPIIGVLENTLEYVPNGLVALNGHPTLNQAVGYNVVMVLKHESSYVRVES